MRALLVAIGFLTRIPVPAFDDMRARSRSLAWYPAVGLLLGALLVLLAWVLRDTPSLVRGALLLTVWVALTGALHLDGLADSADAWVGGIGDRERTLAIMKDPRSGPAGVVAVILLLLLKFAALASLSWPALWPALWMAPLLARAAPVGLFLTTPYVRSGGLGDRLQRAPRAACVVALLASAAACAPARWRGALALAIAVAVLLLWRRAGMRRIAGFTGDTAGALIEMVEAAVLTALALG